LLCTSSLTGVSGGMAIQLVLEPNVS
jgi:hypothetical protein